MNEPTTPNAAEPKPDWKRFERIVASLHVTPGVLVEHNIKAFGASGCEYQIDVRVTHPAPPPHRPFVILISCKDWRARVDRPAVAEFKAVLDDCRATRGAMFSTSGFSDGSARR